jgi:LTXXQ motif family protein
VRSVVLSICFLLAVATGAAGQGEPAKLTQLHDALRLTAAQETAWLVYVVAVAPDPTALARRRAADMLLPQLPTPRRIALVDAAMAHDLADFRRQGAAIDAFYARLTPGQQRIFDLKTLPATGGQTQP